MATITTKKEVGIKSKLNDILVDISWAKIAMRYFGRSSSWIYHKLDGVDGNGKEKGFTNEEHKQFKNALFDLSDRIRKTAEKL